MSVGRQALKTETIYIEVEHEGIAVWRPVEAESREDDPNWKPDRAAQEKYDASPRLI